MIKVSQAVSFEIVLDKLIETLMWTAIEQAGAAARPARSHAGDRAADRGGGHNRPNDCRDTSDRRP